MNKFNIGDVIKVIDVAQSYTTYFEWAEQHNLNQYSLDSLPFKGEEGIIVTKGYHYNNVDFLYGIEINGCHYILSEKGLELACNNPATTLEAVFKHLYPEPKEVVGWRGNTLLIDWAYVLNECFDMSRMLRYDGDTVVATDVLNSFK